MSDPKDEILEKLRAAGWDPDNPEWVQRQKVDLGNLPTLHRQREILRTLETLLQGQVAADLEQMERAREQLTRLRRGGGQ